MKRGMNAREVLANAERLRRDAENELRDNPYLKGKAYYIRDVCHDLSIFDWWHDRLSISQLKQIEGFLKTAIRMGYDGYVCFKVGAEGCASGMWAYKVGSLDGRSPDDAEFIYRSFQSRHNYWEHYTADGQSLARRKGLAYGEIRTPKELRKVMGS
jgi:hypothetical protein